MFELGCPGQTSVMLRYPRFSGDVNNATLRLTAVHNTTDLADRALLHVLSHENQCQAVIVKLADVSDEIVDIQFGSSHSSIFDELFELACDVNTSEVNVSNESHEQNIDGPFFVLHPSTVGYPHSLGNLHSGHSAIRQREVQTASSAAESPCSTGT
eukprot:3321165-Rhodomonas_salina.2